MTFTLALGLTLRMPRVKALMPITTSGIGKAATMPATLDLVILPAMTPFR